MESCIGATPAPFASAPIQRPTSWASFSSSVMCAMRSVTRAARRSVSVLCSAAVVVIAFTAVTAALPPGGIGN